MVVKMSSRRNAKKSKSSQEQDQKEQPAPAVCHHDDPTNFEPVDNNLYFSASYLEKTPNAPKKCCKESCSSGQFGKEYKAGMKRPVYCCVNAKNSLHPCTHAYCKPCFLEWQSECLTSSSSNNAMNNIRITGGRRTRMTRQGE